MLLVIKMPQRQEGSLLPLMNIAFAAYTVREKKRRQESDRECGQSERQLRIW